MKRLTLATCIFYIYKKVGFSFISDFKIVVINMLNFIVNILFTFCFLCTFLEILKITPFFKFSSYFLIFKVINSKFGETFSAWLYISIPKRFRVWRKNAKTGGILECYLFFWSSCTWLGSAFQSMIVLRRKAYLYASTDG